jgi:hypothetical protein
MELGSQAALNAATFEGVATLDVSFPTLRPVVLRHLSVTNMQLCGNVETLTGAFPLQYPLQMTCGGAATDCVGFPTSSLDRLRYRASFGGVATLGVAFPAPCATSFRD